MIASPSGSIGILELNSVKIIHNTSLEDGGGIFNYGNKHADLYRNVLIANNFSTRYTEEVYTILLILMKIHY